jgi:glucosamine--fructose-6-phosphate aminotransferase (isomerizing)
MPLYDEILEQPEVLAGLLNSQQKNIEEIVKSVGKPKGIFIAARGTSDNAARYAKYVWGSYNRIPVALAAPSLFSIYNKPPDLSGMLVVGISQSGESPDLLSVMKEANRQGCATLAITNHKDSPLAKQSSYLIDIQAGSELSVAATKSYSAQLGAIAMLSAAWNNHEDQWNEIRGVPELMSQALEVESQIENFAPRYRYMDQCVVLGRGYNYATAYEWSLKLKELTYVVAQPYSSADFQHGPIALVSNGFPVFAIAPQGEIFADMAKLLKRLKQEHQADLFLISDNQAVLELADCPISLPEGIPEWLTPIIGILPAQLFSYHLTLVKRIDPDAPRGLTKITRTN